MFPDLWDFQNSKAIHHSFLHFSLGRNLSMLPRYICVQNIGLRWSFLPYGFTVWHLSTQHDFLWPSKVLIIRWKILLFLDSHSSFLKNSTLTPPSPIICVYLSVANWQIFGNISTQLSWPLSSYKFSVCSVGKGCVILGKHLFVPRLQNNFPKLIISP